MIFGHFLVIFFSFGSTDRRNIVRDLKIFLEVVRNMLDTLLKFGGIRLSSFRDQAVPKLKIFENFDFLNEFP